MGKEVFAKIESRLDSYMVGRIYPTEIATTFNFVLFDELKSNDYNPKFVGEYFIDPLSVRDPKKPIQTRVLCHQGTEACSPLDVGKRGVIARAIRLSKDQYVSDVTEDPEHIGCDPNMKGSELVLITWSPELTTTQYRGDRIPLGVLDIDVNVKYAFDEEDRLALRRIWDKYGGLVFKDQRVLRPSIKAARAFSVLERSLAS